MFEMSNVSVLGYNYIYLKACKNKSQILQFLMLSLVLTAFSE